MQMNYQTDIKRVMSIIEDGCQPIPPIKKTVWETMSMTWFYRFLRVGATGFEPAT